MLQDPDLNVTNRVASCWYTPDNVSSFDIDLSFTGGPHTFSIYALDWDMNNRNETFQILDTSGHVLDTETISDFSNGVYLKWSITGQVKLRVTNNITQGPNPSLNAVISGLFFGCGT